MAEITVPAPSTFMTHITPRRLIAMAVAAAAAVLLAFVVRDYAALPADHAALTESTLGQLAVWMADQSGEDAPEALFGQMAKSWAAARGEETLDEGAAVDAMRWPVAAIGLLAVLLALAGMRAQFAPEPKRRWWVLALGLCISLLFLIPVPEGGSFHAQILLTGILLVFAIGVSLERPNRVVGFVVVLAVLLISVETMKSFAASVGYKIAVETPDWTYSTYETLDAGLMSVQNGEIRALFADANMLEEYADSGSMPDGLAVIENLARDQYRLGLPVQPAMPARFAVVVRDEDAAALGAVSDLLDDPVGAVAGDVAETNFLALPRAWQLIDLRIFNELNMPRLQAVAEAFLQPARRNGPLLLARILAGNAIYTWTEAALGFTFGAALGFVLGSVFAHSKLLERGLLPYVIASQTVPILAIAPMVVIWLGAGPAAVAVISAYLTFFPVTINTLRGLTSPKPVQIDLMRSYAASRWTIYTKLRLPAAVPYIFTALKVSATASVVGAVIGELPSSIRDGLARAILDFSSSYSEVSTPKLYAAIVSASLVGILFFVLVSLVERIAMRRYLPHSE